MGPFEEILVPVDESPHARRALRVAAGIAARFGGRLRAVHAVAPDGKRGPADLFLGGLTREAIPFEQIASSVRTEVVSGEPADAIMAEVERRRPDLVVMGTHGRTGLERLLVGSVAESVLRAAKVPIVLVHETGGARSESDQSERPEQLLPLGSIVAPVEVDDAAGSAEALALAVELAQRSRKPLHVVHVLPAALGDELGATRTRAAAPGSFIAQVWDKLERLRASALERTPDAQIQLHLRAGALPEALIGFIRAFDVGLVVMRSHARHGLPRLLLGSVAESLVRQAPCPVLIQPAAKVARAGTVDQMRDAATR